MPYSVSATRMPRSALFDMKGRPDSIEAWSGGILPEFPDVPNSYSYGTRTELYWVGQEHWLMRSPIDLEESLCRDLRPEEAPASVSITLVSDAYAFFEITGADARELLAVASPLDVDAMPLRFATFTEAFGQKALLIGREGSFEIAVENSFSSMFADCFSRAIG